MSNSSIKGAGRKPTKPDKPYPDFPLFPHATRRWAKKIRGKMHYFGPWDDPDGALQRFVEQRDDLMAGRLPRVSPAGVTGKTLADLTDRFLATKHLLADRGELSRRTVHDYRTTCRHIAKEFGKGRLLTDLQTDDFEKFRASLGETRGPVALGNEIQRVRVVFKFAFDAGLVDQPMRYGPGFKRPSKMVLRKARAAKGLRMFEADQLWAILEAARPQLKAMVLLGINVGFGNTDCASLPLSSVDLSSGWVDFPRPKTGVHRRGKLWPETIKAIREVIGARPESKDQSDADLVFLTRTRQRWTNDEAAGSPITAEMTKVLKALKFHRPGLNFYALRHTFETIAGETLDQPAVDLIMGHARDDMASIYRERISTDRIVAVANHVRAWLWPPKKPPRARPRRSRA